MSRDVSDRVDHLVRHVLGRLQPGRSPGLGCPGTSPTGSITWFGMSQDLSYRVDHLVRHVLGRLRPGRSPGSACPGTSPTGSITWFGMSSDVSDRVDHLVRHVPACPRTSATGAPRRWTMAPHPWDARPNVPRPVPWDTLGQHPGTAPWDSTLGQPGTLRRIRRDLRRSRLARALYYLVLTVYSSWAT
jgi:hypothetical protein